MPVYTALNSEEASGQVSSHMRTKMRVYIASIRLRT